MNRLLKFAFTLCLSCVYVLAFSQETSLTEIKGQLLDAQSQEPLLYANIYALKTAKGIISNEKGHYSLDISDLEMADTIRFQYMGYKSKNIALSQLIKNPSVALEQDIIKLGETMIFGNVVNPKEVIETVTEKLTSNYSSIDVEREVFIRQRYSSDIKHLDLKYKKSSISEVDQNTITTLQEKVPRHSISYTDFYGKMFLSRTPPDSLPFKLQPIRVVSLDDEDLTEMKKITNVFEKAFKDTDSTEYWKVKTGIIGGKIDIEGEDSTETDLQDNEQVLSDYSSGLKYQLSNAKFYENEWEFLYKTSRYEYTLMGGSRINDEDIYIIDFKPKNKGMYEGRLFISMQSHAILRADYQYAPGKTGKDFSLLGVSYTEAQYTASVHFEKMDSTYQLKYLSYKKLDRYSFDRKMALIKKRKRPFFDKTLNELKTAINISAQNESSFEFLVLSHNSISPQSYDDFNEQNAMEVLYIDQFSDDLWEGYNIIEPTKKMREYKKYIND